MYNSLWIIQEFIFSFLQVLVIEHRALWILSKHCTNHRATSLVQEKYYFVITFFFFILVMVLGFELMALHLLGKCSATLPNNNYYIIR
jgi:hypothetical protein